jgi:Fe-S cluster assembly protein SufD
MKTNPALEELKSSLISQIRNLSGNADFQPETALSFPGVKNEEWKYSPFQIPKDTTFVIQKEGTHASGLFSNEEFGECILLVFINGSFQPNLSENSFPSGFRVGSPEKSGKSIPAFENTLFSQLNDATRHQGIYIDVAPKTVIEKPVIFLHLQTAQTTGLWSQPRVEINVGELAEISFAEIWRNENVQPTVVNSITEVKVRKSAFVKWLNFEKGTASLSQVHQTRVETEEKAIFQHVVVAMGEGYIRNNLEIKISGSQGDAHMYGLTLGNNKLLADHHTFINHKPENTTSNQLYKGVFTSKSTGVFNGRIRKPRKQMHINPAKTFFYQPMLKFMPSLNLRFLPTM